MSEEEKDAQPSAPEPDQSGIQGRLAALRSGQNAVHLTAAAAGFLIATGIALATGIPAAWAAPAYFVVGWPLMCVVIYLLARAYPLRAWRWTLSMMLGQVFSSIFFGGGALVPVAIIYVTLLSVPQFYAGSLGSRAGLKRMGLDNNRG